MYSLGYVATKTKCSNENNTLLLTCREVIGPSLGAALTDHFGFPLCATVMSGLCLTLVRIKNSLATCVF